MEGNIPLKSFDVHLWPALRVKMNLNRVLGYFSEGQDKY